MNRELTLIRPEPLANEVEWVPFTKRMDPQEAVDDLVAGTYVLVKDFYSSGLLVLSELRKYIRQHYADESYEGQRESRAAFREFSNRLLLRVRDHRLVARKAPAIGWLSILYPGTNDFLLSFAQVQGLNSAWQWYQKGISIPVLGGKVFPFYGTYFPTRFEHLELLETWLKEYQGSKASAVGSGVITYQLLNHGFAKVVATDANPNAIHGMQEAITKRKLTAKVELLWGDLFARCDHQTDFIVFNPPWLPLAGDNEGIDQAMYYDGDLFPRFFAEAVKHLKPEGKLVLLFSNLARITQVADTNPIEEELKTGGRFAKELLRKSKVKPASKQTRRNQTWRETEEVELWVLRARN